MLIIEWSKIDRSAFVPNALLEKYPSDGLTSHLLNTSSF